MLFAVITLFLVAGGSAFGRELPQAARHSNDVYEDARLDAPALIKKYGYPCEVHHARTADGYILGMQRIPHGRDRNNVPGDRPVAFVMHGLFSSSADFISMGPGTALAYQLAEQGFDVWLGNARGNTYSRAHTRLDPNSGIEFWQFSWHEIGSEDLPAMINYALAHTGHKRLHYLGHSQGTTSFFVMATTRREMNAKIQSMQALAPVVFMDKVASRLLQFISPFANDIDRVLGMIGLGELLPNHDIFTWAGQTFCNDEAVFQPLCSNLLFLVAGWNPSQLNETMIPVMLGHTPAGASTKQLVHYAQGIESGDFRWLSYGSVQNIVRYGSRTPPEYNLRAVTAPVALHYSDTDVFAHVDNVDTLFRQLPNCMGKFRVPQSTFSHLDFMWGIDANTLVYQRAINLMWAMEN